MKVLIVESPTKSENLKPLLPDWKVLPLYLPSPNDIGQGEKRDWSKEDFLHLRECMPSVADEDVFIMSCQSWRGQALAYHICKTLEFKLEVPRMIYVSSIIKEEVEIAIANPEKINLSWMGAYECGRAMDKLLGFRLAPVIWKELKSDSYLPVSRLATLILQLIIEKSEVADLTREEVFHRMHEKQLLSDYDYTLALKQLTSRAYIKHEGDGLVLLPKGKRYVSFIRKRLPFLLKVEFHLQLHDHILAVSEGRESYQEVVYLFYQALRDALKKGRVKRERREHRALNLHIEQES